MGGGGGGQSGCIRTKSLHLPIRDVSSRGVSVRGRQRLSFTYQHPVDTNRYPTRRRIHKCKTKIHQYPYTCSGCFHTTALPVPYLTRQLTHLAGQMYTIRTLEEATTAITGHNISYGMSWWKAVCHRRVIYVYA